MLFAILIAICIIFVLSVSNVSGLFVVVTRIAVLPIYSKSLPQPSPGLIPEDSKHQIVPGADLPIHASIAIIGLLKKFLTHKRFANIFTFALFTGFFIVPYTFNVGSISDNT